MYSLFVNPVNGSWSDLRVPAGSHFGINRDGPSPGRWHSALTFEYDTNRVFDLRPVGAGSLHCDFRPGTLHLEHPHRDLLGIAAVGRAFVEPVVDGTYADIPLLPFPDLQEDRDALFHAIENFDGSIKLILRLEEAQRISLGNDLGTVSYFVYESVDILSLYNALLSGLTTQPLDKRARGPLRGAYNIGQRFKADLAVTWDDVFRLFLLGLVTAEVDPAAVPTLGQPGRVDSNTRRVSLWAFTEHGAVDPVTVFRKLADGGTLADYGSGTPVTTFFSPPAPAGNGAVEPTFAWDSTGQHVEARTVLAQHSIALTIDKPVFVPTRAADGTIPDSDPALASRFLYPVPMLNVCCRALGMDKAEWRAVGDGQKRLFRQRLPSPGAAGGAAQLRSYFDWMDRYNVFQLEAAVEHFCLGTRDPFGITPADPDRVFLPDETVVRFTADFLAPAPLGWNATRTSSLYLVQIDWMADLGGPRTGLRINTGRTGDRLADEYEGCVFVVAPRGESQPSEAARVRHIAIGFASLTSKGPEATSKQGLPGSENASSIEGNRRYLFLSRRSPAKKGHNYAFQVTRDRGLGFVGKLPGWFYWGTETPRREPGIADDSGPTPYKKAIIIHRGNQVVARGAPSGSGWHGSHGCEVAPPDTYYDLRAELCQVWLDEHNGDSSSHEYRQIKRVQVSTRVKSELVWNDTINHEVAEKLWADVLTAYQNLTESEWEGVGVQATAVVGELEPALAELEAEGESKRMAGKIIPAQDWNEKIAGTYYLIRPFEQTAAPRRRMILRPS